MKYRWKSLCIALLIVLAGGAARLPLEQAYTKNMRQEQLLEKPLNLSMRDELGQTFFIAVLGGFRSVVASIMELKAITPWQQSNWGIVEELYSICTRLQPREEHYWETRGWHLAVNARDTYLLDSMLTEANRHALAQQYVERGIAVTREGLTHLPDSWKLWDRLGYYSSMRWNEKPDHAAAAEYFAKAAAAPGGRRFLWRQHVYEVVRIPGREREAWDKLLALFNSGDELDRTLTVELELLLLFPKISGEPKPRLPELLERIAADRNLTVEEKRHSRLLLERCEERISGIPNHTAAAESYASAATAFDGRGFYRRLHVSEVARIPGREREAWNKLLQLYSSIHELDHTLNVEVELVRLHFQVFPGQPEFKLPAPLYRLIDPEAAASLTEMERKHSIELRNKYEARINPRKGPGRAPVVESPNLRKARP